MLSYLASFTPESSARDCNVGSPETAVFIVRDILRKTNKTSPTRFCSNFEDDILLTNKVWRAPDANKVSFAKNFSSAHHPDEVLFNTVACSASLARLVCDVVEFSMHM